MNNIFEEIKKKKKNQRNDKEEIIDSIECEASGSEQNVLCDFLFHLFIFSNFSQMCVLYVCVCC